ncbi:MAG: dTMP kinase, partial [Chitinophagaceae bacterium]
IDPRISMERISKGRNTPELYETNENLVKVRDKYFEAFEKLRFKENIFITDGNRPAEIIATDIWNEISRMAVTAKSH